jgi:pimeloyl-ACP methyl ester carboxylesterase
VSFPEPSFVPTNGIRMAVHERGAGFPVILSHGWPELAYSWRHQVEALAAAGYRAIAPDQRGYGATEAPEPIDAYDIHHLTGDLVGLLDALSLERAVFCGHDWGGLVVWSMALLHPGRVAGVIGVNTPFLSRSPAQPLPLMRATLGESFYIVQFQEPGRAEAVLERDVRATLSLMFRKGVTAEEYRQRAEERAQEIGGGLLEAVERGEPFGEPLLSDEELDVYALAYEKTGFRGGINWYRNIDRNWELSEGVAQRVEAPALMVSAADDPVLTPAMTEGMEAYVPDLEKRVVERCGHWTQQERPEELNRLMIDWLRRRGF